MRRNLLESHKQALIEKLKETSDNPPVVLHLAVLILFQNVTQSMLTASGRFVADILGFLNGRLPDDNFATLQQYHGKNTHVMWNSLVLKYYRGIYNFFFHFSISVLVKKLIMLNEGDEEYATIISELKEATPSVKEIVFSFSNKWNIINFNVV